MHFPLYGNFRKNCYPVAFNDSPLGGFKVFVKEEKGL